MTLHRSLLFVGLTLSVSGLHAQPTFPNTGVGPYTTTGGDGTLVNWAHPNYFPDGPNSFWVSPNALGDPGCTSCTSPYSVSTTIMLTAAEVANLLLNGMWGVDNGATIFLNNVNTGVSLPTSGGGDNFRELHPFQITGFVEGANTLRIDVLNDQDQPPGPTALRLEGEFTNTAIPEPGSIALITSGLLLLFARRKLRSSV
jgi:hypothetical protein